LQAAFLTVILVAGSLNYTQPFSQTTFLASTFCCTQSSQANARAKAGTGENQSVSQSVNQSINQSINQPTNQPTNQPINQTSLAVQV